MPGEYNVSSTFNVTYLSPFDVGDDLRTNHFQEGGNDGGMTRKWSAYTLEVPLGPMTQDRAKRFKEALNVLIRNAQVEEAHMFNSNVIKVNPELDQELGRF